MFNSARLLATALVAATVFAAAVAGTTNAQADVYVVDGVLEWVWVPARTESIRVYQRSSWVWSPALGWHRHDRWGYVPHVVLGHWEQHTRMLDVFSK